MFKLRNHNIILPKYLEIVKKKGSSLNFSAHGGWGKEKNLKPAEKIAVGSEGAAEGGCGGNSAAPEPKRSPAALPEALRAEPSKNIFFSLIEKNFRGRAKSKIVEKMFLLGLRACRAVAGLASLVWFRSAVFDKMSSSQTVKTHQNLTFRKFTDFFVGGAKRRPLILWGEFNAFRRANARLSARQDEVRLPCDFNSVSDLLCPIIL